MPHLRIEYSPGLAQRADIDAVCRAAYSAMKEAGIFPLAGIRVRAYAADHCIVADDLAQNDFAALTLSIGAGRDKQALQVAGERIFTAVQAALAGPLATPHFALSLEIRVIDPDLSWKDTPIHARLSGNK
ncbi:5-carboxymethyl-2-hydroxymuconate Delta-isomerase [Halomonas kalidii]|uniref:5-carboxymethyl-2-hydroxymuconate Delta-isomerase n=1 Tax=Halomonas kalidii TaxID=3043293 RepID=A0ABT6VP03_9GAMM|nr:5-carboxymethyl-2-hydroxymuconate Delta-isomerase [Halomonas kalidii]MDI5934982.1 5-carboxymethyl-2-hydroxymuconate Delta-isomerase [Halomonas kalidii]